MVVHLSAAGWKIWYCSVQSSCALAHGGVRGNVISDEKWFWRFVMVLLDGCVLLMLRLNSDLQCKYLLFYGRGVGFVHFEGPPMLPC
jgi:hypothetical protein